MAAKFGSSDLVLTLSPRGVYQIWFPRTLVCSKQSGCCCPWQDGGSGGHHHSAVPRWETCGAKPLGGCRVVLLGLSFVERVKCSKTRVQGRRV